MKFIALTIVALFGLSATFLNAQSVPFVIPGDDSSVSATDFSRLLDEPAGAKGFPFVVSPHDAVYFDGLVIDWAELENGTAGFEFQHPILN